MLSNYQNLLHFHQRGREQSLSQSELKRFIYSSCGPNWGTSEFWVNFTLFWDNKQVGTQVRFKYLTSCWCCRWSFSPSLLWSDTIVFKKMCHRCVNNTDLMEGVITLKQSFSVIFLWWMHFVTRNYSRGADVYWCPARATNQSKCDMSILPRRLLVYFNRRNTQHFFNVRNRIFLCLNV